MALICLEKQCLGVFRGFFVVFSWLFRGFFVALILGKFYAYSPWKSLLNFCASHTPYKTLRTPYFVVFGGFCRGSVVGGAFVEVL